jgi:SAM-dependent methyltransferase
MTDDLWGAGDYRAVADVAVDWLEEDAQSLPFDDDSFDRVVSAIEHMFAPDHERTANELLRVCRPDGRIAIARWTPEGRFERLGAISAPPPGDFQPPALWGAEEHVRQLLGGTVEFERQNVDFVEPSPEICADFMLTNFPPLVTMRAELGDDLVRETYLDWVNDVNEADDGTLRYRGEYLLSATV